MFGLGALELSILAAIIVLLFGPKLIPAIARNVGESIRQTRAVFKKGNDQ